MSIRRVLTTIVESITGVFQAPSGITLMLRGGGGGVAGVTIKPQATATDNIAEFQQADATPLFLAKADGRFVGGKFNDYSGATFGGRGKLAGIPQGGAGDVMGITTLVAGEATPATTAVTAKSHPMIFMYTPGGTLGVQYSVPTITAGTSFVINSLKTDGTVQAADTSTVWWFLVDEA